MFIMTVSFKRVYLYETFFPLSPFPIFHEFISMQVEPFKDQIQCPSWKRACNYPVFNTYLRCVFIVLYMEMWRIMFAEIHVNEYSVKWLISGISYLLLINLVLHKDNLFIFNRITGKQKSTCKQCKCFIIKAV